MYLNTLLKFLLATSILVSTQGILEAQEGANFMERVSKEKTLSLSSTYIFRNDIENLATTGFGASFEFGYKISGYKKKSPVYLSIPLEYNRYASSGENIGINILSYGWKLRHQFMKDKKVRPFVDYSLLLSQLRLEEIEGYQIGHQTRFGLGANFGDHKKKKLIYFVKLEYGYHNFPERGVADTKHMHTLVFRVGARLLKKNVLDKSGM